MASLQVIEHVWNHAEFVGECLRVLRPGGALLITTPNRLTFSPGRDTPRNPFHTHEFTADELVAMLTSSGAEPVRVFGLHAGARLLALDRKYGGSFADAQIATSPPEWSDELAGDVAGVRTADFAMTGERIDSCLDLVVVARVAS